MRNTVPASYTAVPISVTTTIGHDHRNHRSRSRHPLGHLRRTAGHVTGITGHVGPEYSHAAQFLRCQCFCLAHVALSGIKVKQSCSVFSLVTVGQPLQRVLANRRVSIFNNDLQRRSKLLHISFDLALPFRRSRKSHTQRQHAVQPCKRWERHLATLVAEPTKRCAVGTI